MARQSGSRRSGARSTPTSAAGGLPTKAEILAFIEGSPRRVGRREISRAFDLKASDRDALNALLREIKSERGGHAGRTSAAANRPGGLPPVGIATVSKVDEDGVAFVVPRAEEADIAALPLRGLKNDAIRVALAPGDRVLARFVIPKTGAEEAHARLIRRLPGGERRLTGVVSGTRKSGFWLEPVSKRGGDGMSLQEGPHRIQAGDLVTAETIDRSRPRAARVIEVHGAAAEPGQTSLIAIHEYGLAHEFSRAVLDEAENARPARPCKARQPRRYPIRHDRSRRRPRP